MSFTCGILPHVPRIEKTKLFVTLLKAGWLKRPDFACGSNKLSPALT